MAATFDHLILNGRPAGGKSELIDFLKSVPLAERREQLHIGDIVELDDFVWLWEKFVEDDLWEALGEARLYSRTVPHGYVQLEGDRLLELLLSKFNAVIKRDYLARPELYDRLTLFIEFARGVADGGYAAAYRALGPEILERAAILYISVSFEESCRRNEARYQEKLAHSILAHKLPDEALERFSAQQDWEEVTGGRPSGYLELHGLRVPFIKVHNEPELKDPVALSERYGPALRQLMSLYQAK